MSRPIRFLLNGEPCEVRGVDPHTSVLAWLREQARLVGTKEGCNEGDCGACTVVLGQRRGTALKLSPINACLRLLPTIDGCALFTVEGLQALSGGALHPVQQAMVEAHASQCGFCTPGFVMTLFALFKTTEAPLAREAICAAISGNLCRCTGYRPILEAAQTMHSLAAGHSPDDPIARWACTPGHASAAEAGQRMLLERLAALETAEPLDYRASGTRFVAPHTLEAFSALVAEAPHAWIVAGTTDVGLWINKALRRADTLISPACVPALARVEEGERALTIGAAVTLEEAFRALDRHYPEFLHLWQRFASWPIRSAATLVGNVANGSPIGDSLPVLIALGAEVVLQHGAVTRRLPLEALYLDYRKQARAPGEWLRAIVVPTRACWAERGARLIFAAYKNAKRNEQDISAVCSALALALDEAGRVVAARVACGGMAPIVKRARAVEAALIGAPWSEATVEAAGSALERDFAPISDLRASAGYRLRVARAHVRRAWLESQVESNTEAFRVC
ncbi:MAG: xanthine dehydrogenase small subunit [Casimicrobiaceae bacterium]|nr:xanthine dehydrogenase small subunit [Casimicrobiaceae bacterium]MCX8097489.1 xanthine dehydrogenase small subunit [Casimicrobiaceae bacterium]MDW8311207.1 xanthine dehydrogenase small subunit [Burkholderiales bacterium]